MHIFNSFEEIKHDSDTVLTLGTFDGVHKGHQIIIKRLLEISKNENLRHVLITIDPHPQIVLQKLGKDPIKLLSVINERVKLLERFNIENVFIIPFSYEFSQTSPEIFVKEYLLKKIGMKKILIGYDHMFGKNREGDKNLLDRLSKEYNFEVEKINPFQNENITISSTKIRNALKEGKLDLANDMLGYNYFASGYVTKGTRRGTKLGFPTANIAIPDKHKQLPGNGVYLVSTKLKDCEYFGMANIGIRPTFSEDNETTLEVHFFDFDSDIYMMELSIQFLNFLRPEIKFKSSVELVEQIKKDQVDCFDLIKNFLNS